MLSPGRLMLLRNASRAAPICFSSSARRSLPAGSSDAPLEVNLCRCQRNVARFWASSCLPMSLLAKRSYRACSAELVNFCSNRSVALAKKSKMAPAQASSRPTNGEAAYNTVRS
ncbi:hypothetical protein D3C75_843640 [compost metagenome]